MTVDVDALPALTDPRLYEAGDPYRVWHALRQENPVWWHERDGHPAFWSITGYEPGQQVLRDWRRFTSTNGTMLRMELSEPYPGAGKMLVLTDPPRHDAIRKALAPLFTPRAITRLAARARYAIGSILDDALDAGQCDFATDVAARVPLAVSGELLGVREDAGLIERAMTTVATSDIETLEAQEAHLQILGYYANAVKSGSSCPADNMVSALLDPGLSLTTEEIVLTCDNVVVAASETTQQTATSGLAAMLAHPEQWQAFRSGLVDVSSAVDEILRWAPPITHILRTATRDTTLSGVDIRAGEAVVVWIPSVNRDETVFTRGENLDLTRRPNPHLTFGTGVHFCLGATLARLVLSILYEELIAKVETISLIGTPRRRASFHVWGYSSLPVELRAR